MDVDELVSEKNQLSESLTSIESIEYSEIDGEEPSPIEVYQTQSITC